MTKTATATTEKKERKILSHKDLDFGQELFYLDMRDIHNTSLKRIVVEEMRKEVVMYKSSPFAYTSLFLTQDEAVEEMERVLEERKQKKMYILRNKADHRPLGVAISKEGLQWIVDPKGKYVYFNKATTKIVNGKLIFIGDTSMSSDVYVEIYEYRKHRNYQIKQIEDKVSEKVRHFGNSNISK